MLALGVEVLAFIVILCVDSSRRGLLGRSNRPLVVVIVSENLAVTVEVSSQQP